jgi:hypothetical protein
MQEDKHGKFKRLAKQRGERILKDLQLLGNLSNTNNYTYTEADVKKIFATLEQELRFSRSRFQKTISRNRGIDI